MGKFILKLIGVILAFVIVIGFIGFVAGWFNKGKEIVGPENVEQQFSVVITHYESLIAASENACQVQEAGTGESSDRDPTLIEGPELAYAAQYRKIEAKYISTVDDAFKAGIVKPFGYPTSEEIRMINTNDWCTVSQQLELLAP